MTPLLFALYGCSGDEENDQKGHGASGGATQQPSGGGGSSAGLSSAGASSGGTPASGGSAEPRSGNGGAPDSGGSAGSGGLQGTAGVPAGTSEFPPIPPTYDNFGTVVVWDDGWETTFYCIPEGVSIDSPNIIIVCAGLYTIDVHFDLLDGVVPGTHLIDSSLKDDLLVFDLFDEAGTTGILVHASDDGYTHFTGTLVIEEVGNLPGEELRFTLQAKWPESHVWVNNVEMMTRPGSLAMTFSYVNPP